MVLKQLFGKKDEKAPVKLAETVESAPDAAKSSVKVGASAQDENAPAGEPVPALHLEKAMIENARNDNAETRKLVYQELLFSDLILALAEPEAGAEGVDPNQLSVAILSNSSNVQFAAAFTSADAAKRWRAEGGRYVSVRGQDIFKLLEPSPAEVVVINPGSAPFIALPKVEYKQLAMGVIPQTGRSPVQTAAAAAEEPNQEIQLAFPPDVFSEEQKVTATEKMKGHARVEAAALGAILPVGATKDAWVRAVFLRVEGPNEDQEAMQKLCKEVQDSIMSSGALFESTGFEVGVMPDPNFWIAMHQNNVILFDKNPPALPETPAQA